MLQAIDRCSVSSNKGSDAIQAFATMYRLKARIDEDGTKIIPGRFGHIYEYDNGVFGVMVMPHPPRRKYWGCLRTALLKAGFSITQNGDGEGAAVFDPQNPRQAQLAIQAAGINRKRRISSDQRERQIARLRDSAGRAHSAVAKRREARAMQRPIPVEVRLPLPRNADAHREGEMQW